MRYSAFLFLFVELVVQTLVEGLAQPLRDTRSNPAAIISASSEASTSRRSLFALGISSAILLGTSDGDAAEAFSNKISDKYDDRPKRRGPQVSGVKLLAVSFCLSSYIKKLAFLTLIHSTPLPT